MTIQDIENLDLYKCSLQDINKAEKGLYLYLRRNVRNHRTKVYKDIQSLYTRVRRAQLGMTEDGYMVGQNTNMDRVPNSESVLI